MSTTTPDDRLSAIEAGIEELRLLTETAVKLARSVRTGTLRTVQSEHTRTLRKHGEQLERILARLDAPGGDASS